MKNLIRTLSLALTVGLFLNAATPAHADFFPEPFQAGARAVPVRTAETAAPQVEKQMLEIKTANPVINKSDADQRWSLPLSNPTPYAPMQTLQNTAAPIGLQATPPIAVPVRTIDNTDRWLAPTTGAPNYDPMR